MSFLAAFLVFLIDPLLLLPALAIGALGRRFWIVAIGAFLLSIALNAWVQATNPLTMRSDFWSLTLFARWCAAFALGAGALLLRRRFSA